MCNWLREAFGLKGVAPTLAVGGDGITMPLQAKGGYEVASCGTITVYAGKRRIGTVYLGYAPESGQPTMTEELLALMADSSLKRNRGSRKHFLGGEVVESFAWSIIN